MSLDQALGNVRDDVIVLHRLITYVMRSWVRSLQETGNASRPEESLRTHLRAAVQQVRHDCGVIEVAFTGHSAA